MKISNVMVTGGAGFIGSHIVAKLVEQLYCVTILDNLSTGKLSNISPKLWDSGLVKFVKGDIRDTLAVKRCLIDVDAVLHLAAQTSVPFSVRNPSVNDEINIKGTSNLLHSSVEAKVEKFIFVSSCAVYGNPVYLPIDEKQPPNPISPYAESKLASEKECVHLNAQGLLKNVVLRLFNVYGPRQGLNDYSGVITKFMDRIKQKLPLIVYGDGSQTRDFVYVQDVVNAILLALENTRVDGEVFNIGTGKATTIQELAETMLSLTNTNLEIAKAPVRSGDIKDSYANISKANKLLGFEPVFPLKNGLKDLLSEIGLLSSKK